MQIYRSNNYKIFINLINVILEYIKDNECKLTPSGYGLREVKKKDISKLYLADVDPGRTKIFINQILCPFHKSLWS